MSRLSEEPLRDFMIKERGQGGVTRVLRTVDLRHIPQALELIFVLSR